MLRSGQAQRLLSTLGGPAAAAGGGTRSCGGDSLAAKNSSPCKAAPHWERHAQEFFHVRPQAIQTTGQRCNKVRWPRLLLERCISRLQTSCPRVPAMAHLSPAHSATNNPTFVSQFTTDLHLVDGFNGYSLCPLQRRPRQKAAGGACIRPGHGLKKPCLFAFACLRVVLSPFARARAKGSFG